MTPQEKAKEIVSRIERQTTMSYAVMTDIIAEGLESYTSPASREEKKKEFLNSIEKDETWIEAARERKAKRETDRLASPAEEIEAKAEKHYNKPVIVTEDGIATDITATLQSGFIEGYRECLRDRLSGIKPVQPTDETSEIEKDLRVYAWAFFESNKFAINRADYLDREDFGNLMDVLQRKYESVLRSQLPSSQTSDEEILRCVEECLNDTLLAKMTVKHILIRIRQKINQRNINRLNAQLALQGVPTKPLTPNKSK